MPWAEATLANDCSERVRQVVRDEALDRGASRDKLYARPRIFDLLSSAELQQGLALATAALRVDPGYDARRSRQW